jgi:RNA polymerase sigma-70 factor (ECF subfamily)
MFEHGGGGGGSSVNDAGDDLPLVRRALQGDERAFAELVGRYEGALYRLAWRMLRNHEEARDVVQETFLRVYRALATYDQERRFSTWILRIATNLSIDHCRRRRVQWVSIEESQEDDRPGIVLAEPGHGPDRQHHDLAVAERLDGLIARLPPIYRAIIELRYKRHLAYEEVAEVLGVPLGTVKARLHRAHRHLKDQLEAAGLGPDSLRS